MINYFEAKLFSIECQGSLQIAYIIVKADSRFKRIITSPMFRSNVAILLYHIAALVKHLAINFGAKRQIAIYIL